MCRIAVVLCVILASKTKRLTGERREEVERLAPLQFRKENRSVFRSVNLVQRCSTCDACITIKGL